MKKFIENKIILKDIYLKYLITKQLYSLSINFIQILVHCFQVADCDGPFFSLFLNAVDLRFYFSFSNRFLSIDIYINQCDMISS